jgi:methionyl-tRNA formyltransferase
VNVAFFGTAAFGASVLRELAARGRVRVESVISQPDRPSGRGRRRRPPPVAVAAAELGLPLRQPEDASAEPPGADAGVVVAYGQIVREPLLSAYPLLNVHPSLLPRWRGAAPVERAIMAGDEETGVAVMGLVAELDAGPVYGCERFPIGTADDAGAIYERAVRLGVPLLERVLVERPAPVPQDEEGVTYAAKLGPEDRWLDWARPAVELERRVRALSPHIGARCTIDGQELVVWRARAVEGGLAPGLVAPPLTVGCESGALELLELQPAGRRRMTADAFVRGLRAAPGRAV